MSDEAKLEELYLGKLISVVVAKVAVYGYATVGDIIISARDKRYFSGLLMKMTREANFTWNTLKGKVQIEVS